MALRLPAVVQTVDERMLQLPLHEHKNSLGVCENTYLVLVHALYSKPHTKFTKLGAKKNYRHPNKVTNKSQEIIFDSLVVGYLNDDLLFDLIHHFIFNNL